MYWSLQLNHKHSVKNTLCDQYSDGVYIIDQYDVFFLEAEGVEVPSELFILLIHQTKIKTLPTKIEKYRQMQLLMLRK